MKSKNTYSKLIPIVIFIMLAALAGNYFYSTLITALTTYTDDSGVKRSIYAKRVCKSPKHYDTMAGLWRAYDKGNVISEMQLSGDGSFTISSIPGMVANSHGMYDYDGETGNLTLHFENDIDAWKYLLTTERLAELKQSDSRVIDMQAGSTPYVEVKLLPNRVSNDKNCVLETNILGMIFEHMITPEFEEN